MQASGATWPAVMRYPVSISGRGKVWVADAVSFAVIAAITGLVISRGHSWRHFRFRQAHKRTCGGLIFRPESVQPTVGSAFGFRHSGQVIEFLHSFENGATLFLGVGQSERRRRGAASRARFDKSISRVGKGTIVLPATCNQRRRIFVQVNLGRPITTSSKPHGPSVRSFSSIAFATANMEPPG